MSSNTKVGEIFGIEIEVQFVLLLIAALFSISVVQHFHKMQSGSVAETWSPALLIVAALLLVSLLLYELAQSLAARRGGLGTPLTSSDQCAYMQAKTTASVLRGMRVSEMMSHGCAVVDGGMGLQDFVDHYLLATTHRCFAVEGKGRVVGLITLAEVCTTSRQHRSQLTVRDAMRPLQEASAITPDTPVLDALKLMLRYNANQLPVLENGSLKGIVFRSQLAYVLRSRTRRTFPPPNDPATRNTAIKRGVLVTTRPPFTDRSNNNSNKLR